MTRKDFKKHNEGFMCLQCGKLNPAAKTGERNHCCACLYSLHIDKETPGDRASECNGLMEPFGVDFKGAKGFIIIHRCIKCRAQARNRILEDDNMEVLNRLT